MFKEDAVITREGVTYTLTLAEQKACETNPNEWHSAGDPTSWLAVKVFQSAKGKCPTREGAIALAAMALGIDTGKLQQLIDWHVNYMRWHDGDDSYDV